MQSSPISASANGVAVVVGGGKMGYVYEMDAATGQLLWKTPVGIHNGHDNDSLKALSHQLTLKAPYTILPGSLGGILSNMAVADDSVYVVTNNVAITATSLDQVLGNKAGKQSGDVEALNLATGKVEWDTTVKVLLWAPRRCRTTWCSRPTYSVPPRPCTATCSCSTALLAPSSSTRSSQAPRTRRSPSRATRC
jgi:glucose dehydrogenase